MPNNITREQLHYFIKFFVIITLLYSTVFVIPFYGIFIFMFTAVPLTFFALRMGRLPCLVLLALVSVFLSTFNLIFALIFLVIFGTIGLIIAEGIGRGYHAYKVIIMSSIISIIISILFINIIMINLGGSPYNFLNDSLRKNIEQSIETLQERGMDQTQIQNFKNYSSAAIDLLAETFWGICIAGIILAVICNYFMSVFFLKKYEYPYLNYTPYSLWVLPDHLIWGFIIAAILWLATKGSQQLKGSGQSLLVIFSVLYLTQGLAITFFFIKKMKVTRPVKWIFFVFILIQLPFLLFPLYLIITGIGLFDTWFDIRRLKNKVMLPT